MVQPKYQAMCLVAGIAALTAGCASTGSLSRNDVILQYAPIAQLDTGVADARARHADLLVPDEFAKADNSLSTAIEAGQNAEKTEALQAANKGLEQLQTIDTKMAQNYTVLEEVLTTRARAAQHGAAGLFEKEFKDTDEDLRKVARLLERGKGDEAAEKRPELIRRYAALELQALQEGLIAAAEDSISRAQQVDADDFAPKTLKEARQELMLARSVLKADRTQIEKSNGHANEAIWLARRAVELTALARAFDDAGSSREDMLRWYQAQLQHVRDASRTARLPLDRPNGEVVAVLRWDVSSLVQTSQDLRRANRLSQERFEGLQERMQLASEAHRRELEGLLAAHETELVAIRGGNRAQINQAEKEASKQVAELQERLSEKSRQIEYEARREYAAQARFEHVRALFQARDADVFRKGEDVLIRLKGFQFRPGGAQIEAVNFALLNNVVSAIAIFPAGQVVVSGHTDSTGNPKNNLVLSAARAQSVAEFLTTVGGLQAARLSVEGRGEDEPVSSNDTSEGRAQNRRIDISIINEAVVGSGPTADRRRVANDSDN